MEQVIVTNGRARGVRFQRPGKLGIKQHYTVYAKKEIIMSAGSIATPQILMLSGIGPKYHLQVSRVNGKRDNVSEREYKSCVFPRVLSCASGTRNPPFPF